MAYDGDVSHYTGVRVALPEAKASVKPSFWQALKLWLRPPLPDQAFVFMKRREELVAALLQQHETQPWSYDQTNPCRCAMATSRRIGHRANGDLYERGSILYGLTDEQSRDIFGPSPFHGTAKDAAARISRLPPPRI